jgi:hypothetical protein
MSRNSKYMIPKYMVDPGSRSAPGWLWIFAIFAVGSFVGLLYYLDQYEKGELNSDRSINFKEIISEVGKGVKEIDIPEVKLKAKEPGKQNFEFYDLLTKLEVVIPEQKEVSAKAESATDKKNITKQKPNIFLQAGAFKDLHAADRMKANLALLGVKSSIKSVFIKDLGRWHRVRVGPFSSKRKMNRIRNLMRTNDIQAIAVKVKAKSLL